MHEGGRESKGYLLSVREGEREQGIFTVCEGGRESKGYLLSVREGERARNTYCP